MTWRNLRRLPRGLFHLLRHDPVARREWRLWLRSLRSESRAWLDAEPSITFGARAWLLETLRPDAKVFEWGSGGSTLFLAARVAELVSVEHDAGWHRRIGAILEARRVRNCRHVLAEPEPASEATEPRYLSSRRRYKDQSFESYVRIVDAWPDGHFDLVFVDGRQRVACGRHALAKIRPGGHLLLDDSQRPEYDELRNLLRGFPSRDFFGLGPYQARPWQTTAWRVG